MKLVFASHNEHKVKEIRAILPEGFHLMSLTDIGWTEDIPETSDTLEGNALQKARFLKDRTGLDCFADDTGLIVSALNGAPGVFSARYAGPQRSAEDNMVKLMTALAGKVDRSAHFRTSIALIIGDKEFLFSGEVHGHIISDRRGGAGFGYDPIFQPDGAEHTFAEMDQAEKNAISHRGRAFSAMIAHLASTAGSVAK